MDLKTPLLPACEFLEARGFREFKPTPDTLPGLKVFYQKRLEGVEPVCACNEKLFINVMLYAMDLHGKLHASAEMDITGEMADGQWAKLQIYAVSVAELDKRFDTLQGRLIAAWQAACGV